MGADRRIVRVSPAFFDQLDDQLRPERGPHGEPSASDFVVMELPAIVERFAKGFDDLPRMIEAISVGRMLIAPGLLVPAFVVYGLLTSDYVVELVAVSIEH